MSPDLLPAAEKLGFSLSLLGHLAQPMAAWQARGFDGPTEKEAVEIMRQTPCEKRTLAGRCNASGCGRSPDKTTYCVWLIRMGVPCPEKKWPAATATP